MIDPEKAVAKLQKQYKRQNEYNKNKYDRVSITLEKGSKEKIQKAGYTINSFFNMLYNNYFENK